MSKRTPHHHRKKVTLDVPYPVVDGTQPCVDDPELFFPKGSRQTAGGRIMIRHPRLIVLEADIVGEEQLAPSKRQHYIVKIGANGEPIWTGQILHNRSNAIRYARREAAEHTVPLRIYRPWLGEEWVPVKGDPHPHPDRHGTAGRAPGHTFRSRKGRIVEVKPR